MVPSLKPERHNCANRLYDERIWAIGETITCSCNRVYKLAEPSLLLSITFWRGYDAWAGGVWVRDKATERRNRKAARR